MKGPCGSLCVCVFASGNSQLVNCAVAVRFRPPWWVEGCRPWDATRHECNSSRSVPATAACGIECSMSCAWSVSLLRLNRGDVAPADLVVALQDFTKWMLQKGRRTRGVSNRHPRLQVIPQNLALFRALRKFFLLETPWHETVHIATPSFISVRPVTCPSKHRAQFCIQYRNSSMLVRPNTQALKPAAPATGTGEQGRAGGRAPACR